MNAKPQARAIRWFDNGIMAQMMPGATMLYYGLVFHFQKENVSQNEEVIREATLQFLNQDFPDCEPVPDGVIEIYYTFDWEAPMYSVLVRIPVWKKGHEVKTPKWENGQEIILSEPLFFDRISDLDKTGLLTVRAMIDAKLAAMETTL